MFKRKESSREAMARSRRSRSPRTPRRSPRRRSPSPRSRSPRSPARPLRRTARSRWDVRRGWETNARRWGGGAAGSSPIWALARPDPTDPEQKVAVLAKDQAKYDKKRRECYVGNLPYGSQAGIRNWALCCETLEQCAASLVIFLVRRFISLGLHEKSPPAIPQSTRDPSSRSPNPPKSGLVIMAPVCCQLRPWIGRIQIRRTKRACGLPSTASSMSCPSFSRDTPTSWTR